MDIHNSLAKVDDVLNFLGQLHSRLITDYQRGVQWSMDHFNRVLLDIFPLNAFSGPENTSPSYRFLSNLEVLLREYYFKLDRYHRDLLKIFQMMSPILQSCVIKKFTGF